MPEVRWPDQVLTGGESEDRFGYSQAVMDRDLIHVSGQVGRDPYTSELIGPRELAVRLDTVFRNIRSMIAELSDDARLAVVHVFLPMPYADAASTFGSCLGGLLGEDRPIVTITPIAALFNPDYLVEVSTVATPLPIQAIPDAGPMGDLLGTSSAVIVGSQIYVAGQLPLDASGELQGETPAEQLKVAVGNLDNVLRSAGSDIGDVMSSQLFVAGVPTPEAMADISAVHTATFGTTKPASTLIFVPELPLGALVQIVAVAALRPE